MTSAIAMLALGLAEKQTLSEIVPAAIQYVHYRRLSPGPRFSRPIFPKSAIMPGARYYAAVGPNGKVALGAVVGTMVMLDLDGNGRFDGVGEKQKLIPGNAPWEKGESGSVKFAGFMPGVDQEEVSLTWHKHDPVPMLSFSAKVGSSDRASRCILCTPSANPAQAPVFNLGEDWSFFPDYINLSIGLADSLYSPGASADVHMEIGTAGLGEHSFVGRLTGDIPASAYVEAAYTFHDARTGKPLSVLATLRGRC